MEYSKIILLLLISSTTPLLRCINGIQQKTLANLTRFEIEGVVGRFVVNREALQQVIQNRKQQDESCGQDVNLQLPQSLAPSAYNASREGEIFLFHGTITDFTLEEELSSDLKEQVATTHTFLAVLTPVVIGNPERHGVLYLRIFTESQKKIIHPYATSIQQVTHLDCMEEAENGIVTLRSGSDLMKYKLQDESNGPKEVGKDFDEATGKVLTLTSYPLPFDWGCDFMGYQTSFCKALQKVQCPLSAVGGDVCVRLATGSSKRVPASMKVFNMTGIFRDMFPYLAETVPAESFEAELVDRVHITEIAFPCLSS